MQHTHEEGRRVNQLKCTGKTTTMGITVQMNGQKLIKSPTVLYFIKGEMSVGNVVIIFL